MTITQRGSMVRRILSAMVFLILLVFAAPLLAQKADRAQVKVGDRWVFATRLGAAAVKSSDVTWVITAVTPTEIEGTENGQPLVLTPELNVVRATLVENSNLELLSFPLKIGKRWRFANDSLLQSSGLRLHGTFSGAVVAYEKVRVPAGEFDTFKVRVKGSWATGGYTGRSSWICWYAPAARAVVRTEYRTTLHELGLRTTELSEIELQR